ncbi:MAG TPA: cell division protein SepF [Nanoarchaeota archaeon]|nr:cell division protein SepF [Nanoarchaeota archaeon]
MILRLFGKEEPKTLAEDEFIELDTTSPEVSGGKIPIKIERLEDFSDTERIQKLVREGAIVFIKIKTLKEKDISELKRAIEKLRKTIIAINGDIAGIEEDWIVLCPSFAHIVRE